MGLIQEVRSMGEYLSNPQFITYCHELNARLALSGEPEVSFGDARHYFDHSYSVEDAYLEEFNDRH